MDLFQGIRRRMELFEAFEEGKRLLCGRKVAVERGMPAPCSLPSVFVSRSEDRRGALCLAILTQEPAAVLLAYALADEADDYLCAVRGLRRTGLADERRGDAFFLYLEYGAHSGPKG